MMRPKMLNLNFVSSSVSQKVSNFLPSPPFSPSQPAFQGLLFPGQGVSPLQAECEECYMNEKLLIPYLSLPAHIG